LVVVLGKVSVDGLIDAPSSNSNPFDKTRTLLAAAARPLHTARAQVLGRELVVAALLSVGPMRVDAL
jgi:hypothetical protein